MRYLSLPIVLFAALALMGLLGTQTAVAADKLYIGDGGDDTVKAFDAKTGAYFGTFVSPGSGGLHGPRGLIFTAGRLDVVNQNVNTPFNGEILQYQRNTGAFLDALVPQSDPNAPFAPRGLIRGSGDKLYVADFDFSQGRVAEYDRTTGQFRGNFTGFSGAFIPRGIVRGPDGLVYVSVTGDLSAGDVRTGYVLRFNSHTGKFRRVFASNGGSGCAQHLHRPEGLVFGPDGKLYVTAFRADSGDNDKVLIFDGETGACLDQIDLDQVGQDRAFAQALLFGPKGRLFVPINGNGPDTGAVRRYNVKTKTFDVFVPSNANGGPLQSGGYLTFGKTDPATLEYED